MYPFIAARCRAVNPVRDLAFIKALYSNSMPHTFYKETFYDNNQSGIYLSRLGEPESVNPKTAKAVFRVLVPGSR